LDRIGVCLKEEGRRSKWLETPSHAVSWIGLLAKNTLPSKPSNPSLQLRVQRWAIVEVKLGFLVELEVSGEFRS
jgi:hypothetical protein